MTELDLDVALGPLREALQSEGYDLRVVSLTASDLSLEVVAGPEACADCLVPKNIFARIIKDSLGGEAGEMHVKVSYPADSNHGDSES